MSRIRDEFPAHALLFPISAAIRLKDVASERTSSVRPRALAPLGSPCATRRAASLISRSGPATRRPTKSERSALTMIAITSAPTKNPVTVSRNIACAAASVSPCSTMS